MKQNIAMASFYCLVRKMWSKIIFYVVVRREKNAWFELLPKRKKLT